MTYITPSKLKSERDWTTGAIKKFLGDPDSTKPNPIFKSAAPMQLYNMNRVINIENNPDFKLWQDKYLERKLNLKSAAKKSVKTKTENTIQQTKEIKIKFPHFNSRKELIEMASDHYENLWQQRGDYDRTVSPTAPHNFIKRITLNYLRHSCTNYDQLVSGIHGCTGIHEAISQLHNRIKQAAINEHPWLR